MAKKRRARRQTPEKEKDWKPSFLKHLAETACVLHAAKKAGVCRATVYEHQKIDPPFATAWQEAVDYANEFLVFEVRRRAIKGWSEPVFQGGKLVGRVKKHSDTLLIFLTKARHPEFRDSTKHELTGADGGPIKLEQADHRIDALLGAALDRSAAREEASPVPSDGL